MDKRDAARLVDQQLLFVKTLQGFNSSSEENALSSTVKVQAMFSAIDRAVHWYLMELGVIAGRESLSLSLPACIDNLMDALSEPATRSGDLILWQELQRALVQGNAHFEAVSVTAYDEKYWLYFLVAAVYSMTYSEPEWLSGQAERVSQAPVQLITTSSNRLCWLNGLHWRHFSVADIIKMAETFQILVQRHRDMSSEY